MPMVKVGDINMYYEIHGEGEPLVLIPGFGVNVDYFFLHIPVFARYYKVVVFDNRGAGRSDAPDIPYTIKMMADDLAGLLDIIGIDSAHIQGASMGGAIAQEFALSYPDKVRSVTLASTGCGSSHRVPPSDPQIIKAFQNPKILPPEENTRQVLSMMISQEFIDKNPELIKQMVKKFSEHPAPLQGTMRQAQTSTSFDSYDRLPTIKAPTLIIHGDADRLNPVENVRILASRIPHAELVILPKMGHGFQYEAFEESNRIILDFLKRHSGSVK